MYKLICELYQEFFRQISLNKNYIYIPDSSGNKKDQYLIVMFIKFLNKNYNQQVDMNFLIDYFKFQFSHYAGTVNSKYGRNSIMIHWIIGPKAIKRWKERDVRKKYIVKIKLKKEVEINLKNVFKINNNNDKIFNKIYDYEERDKERFFNEDIAFNYCLMLTTLFNPKSKFCSGCRFKENCKKVLRENHPNIYKNRIDE